MKTKFLAVLVCGAIATAGVQAFGQAHDHSHEGGADHGDHDHSGETLAFQLPQWKEMHFDDANKANQDRERQINEGQAYANDILPKAEGTASRLRAEANGYQQRFVFDAAHSRAARNPSVIIERKVSPLRMINSAAILFFFA